MAETIAYASLLESGGKASDRVGRLSDAPLLAGGRVHQGQPVRMAARCCQERSRGGIVGGHEAEAAFAAAMAV